MKQSSTTSYNLARNLAVALTLSLAAIATWAVTQSPAPLIEAAAAPIAHG